MNIAINGLFLKEKDVGLAKYSNELIKNFNNTDLSVRLFIPASALDNVNSFPKNVSIHLIEASLKTGSDFIDSRIWETAMFNKMRKENDVVLFSPYFICSPNMIHNEIVTVGDVIQYVFPQYGRSIQERIYHLYNKHYIQYVKKIITFSEYSKKDILRHLPCKPENIYPIHLGVSDKYSPVLNYELKESIIKKYGLPDNYILYVGGYDYRKNVIELIHTFKKLKEDRKQKDLFLLLVGEFPKKIKKFVPDIKKAIKESDVENYIKLLGYVPETDLPYIYNLAKVFVYPSIYEGFGLPILEAIACGTPAIACNVTSIPEIINREDLLYNPGDLHTLVKKIQVIITDNSYRNDLSAWGIERSKEFTWRKTALRTVEVIESDIKY